jgi:hypothetical protein
MGLGMRHRPGSNSSAEEPYTQLALLAGRSDMKDDISDADQWAQQKDIQGANRRRM